MPGSTPNRGYPYPIGTDPIDIAGDYRRLAEAVDLDTAGLDYAVDANTYNIAAEQTARIAADTALGTRITNEHNAWVAGDKANYDGYRADDGYYAVTAWSHGAYRNDKIVLQGSYGEYTCDGYGTFVVGLPVAYPNRYYTPIVTTANTQAWIMTAMDPNFREAGQFRVACRTGGGGSLAGVAVAVWWTTIGVAI